MNIKALIGAGFAFAKKHQGAILTGVSMCAYGYSLYRAIKDSPKILEKLDELNEQEATTMEKAKAILPEVAGIAVPFAAGATAQVLCTKKLSDTVTSLASAVTIYKTLNDEKDKVIEEKDQAIKEVAGEDVARKVNEKITKDRQASYSECPTRKIIHTGEGTELFHDTITNCWFYHDLNKIKDAILELNYEAMSNDIYVDEYAAALHIEAPESVEGLCWRAMQLSHKTIDPRFKARNNDHEMWWEITFNELDMPKAR